MQMALAHGAIGAKVIDPSTVETAPWVRWKCHIDVFATVRRHGFTIEVVRDRSDCQHYFGLVLIG